MTKEERKFILSMWSKDEGRRMISKAGDTKVGDRRNMKCKYCKYYKFDRRVEACHSHGEIQLGKCTKNEREYGCLTLAETEGCPMFERRIIKHQLGDVFVGNITHRINGEGRTDKRAFCIIAINPEYYPAVYRVRDNRKSEYSVDDKWFNDMEKVASVEELRE